MSWHVALEGERILTILVRLRHAARGGGTHFPLLNLTIGAADEPAGRSQLHTGRGDALLFYSMTPAGTKNVLAKHRGMATVGPTGSDGDGGGEEAAGAGGIGGGKWIVNFWFREKRWWGNTHF